MGMTFKVTLDDEAEVLVAVDTFQDDTVEVLGEVRFVLYTEDITFCSVEIHSLVLDPFFKLL